MAFCDDMDALELRVHEKLAGHRPNLDREFFKISCLSAVNTIRNESKQFGELLFEEKSFSSAEEFWQLAQSLHQQNQESIQKYNYDNPCHIAVQKPSSKEHIRIDPPKSRPVNFGQDYEDYARFENDVIWSVYQTSPAGEAKPRVMRLTEQSFEKEINNNFARAFPYNPQGGWVLGSAQTFRKRGISIFIANDPNEPFWYINEDEIITYSELTSRVKSKTTKRDIEKRRQEEAKQKSLDEKRLFEERRKQERRDYEKKQSRSDTIFWWFVALIILSLLINGGRYYQRKKLPHLPTKNKIAKRQSYGYYTSTCSGRV